MDETTGSLSDWFSSTVQSVGTTVANAWADQWTQRNNTPPYAPPPTPASGWSGTPTAVKAQALMQNPLAWLLLLGAGFALYKFARG